MLFLAKAHFPSIPNKKKIIWVDSTTKKGFVWIRYRLIILCHKYDMRYTHKDHYTKSIYIKFLHFYTSTKRECSSNGRAHALHAWGKGIDAPLFQNISFFQWYSPAALLAFKDWLLAGGTHTLWLFLLFFALQYINIKKKVCNSIEGFIIAAEEY